MTKTTVAGLALIWAVACAADEIKPLDVKLGLWETTASTEMPGTPRMQSAPSIPPDVLAKLPPEQRTRMEAMMKARAAGGPMLTTTKVCMTRDSLSNGMAFSRANKSCTTSVITSTPSKQQIHMVCDQAGTKMAGDLVVDRVDSEHIKGNMSMKSVEGPRPVAVKMSFDTKWVSSDCGDVMPPALTP
jgi:hypothetical protein